MFIGQKRYIEKFVKDIIVYYVAEDLDKYKM
jgi:hypothetical protein